MAWMLLVGVGVLWWTFGHQKTVSPDGTFYLRAARREAVPRPYGLRWLIPAALGPDIETWAGARGVWTGLLALLSWSWAYQHQVDPAIFTALALGLSIVRTSWGFPVLVDLPGVCAMLTLAVAGGEAWWLQLGLGIGMGLVHERAPLMGALLAHSPWGLSGVAVTSFLWRRCLRPEDVGYQLPAWLRHPFREARKDARLTAELLLLPWGVGMLALLSPAWTGWDLAVVAAAYAPLLVAQDHARIYQWAFPVVLLHAVRALPPEWAVAAVVVQWLWPWRRVL